MDFPWYSDLGTSSPEMTNEWDAASSRRALYRSYFDGSIFEEKVPREVGIDETELPKLYPVGMNIVKMLCLAQAEALYGEWEDDIIRFKVRQDAQERTSAEAAIQWASTVMNANAGPAMFYELGIDREVYGGSPLKVSPDLGRPGFIRLSRVDIEGFYPIWDPEDPDDFLQVTLVVPMTREQAKLKYGLDTDKDIVQRIETWTKSTYQTTIDEKRVDTFSGINPWGIVPFVYFTRMRTSDWWGDALTPDIIPVQDEINMRVADIGEAINYNAHPTRWGVNLPRKFGTKDYPLGPQAMWDLGKVIGNSPVPTVGILEARNPIPERTLDFINLLYDWTRTSAFAPPIAFGEDQGGGQRSGRTLEIRMWPLLRSTRRSRSYMAVGIARMMHIAAKILQQKNIEGMTHIASRFLDGSVIPDFWPLLPRDEEAIVDRIVKLMSLKNQLGFPMISAETALKWLRLGPSEMDRIKAMFTDPELVKLLQAVSGAGNATSQSKPPSNE